MGRPIQKKYFANTNVGLDGEGVAGESVASTITVANSGTLYSQGTVVTIGAPQIAGGEQATITYSINSAGNITVAKATGGSGYTGAPSLTVTKATTVNTVGTATNASYTLTNLTSVAGIYVGMLADAPWGMQSANYVASVNGTSVTLTKTMSASTASLAIAFSDAGSSYSASTALTTADRQDGLAIYAYIPASGTAGLVDGSGGTQRLLGDVVRQVGGNKYMVRTSEGLGKVKLVYDGVANAAGEADLTATDSSGKTYYVMKLNGRKAKLKQYGTAGHEFTDESWVKWNFDAAEEDVSVSIANA